MKVVIIGSGSKGNCIYIEDEKYNYLIDFGLSYKQVVKRLNDLNIKFNPHYLFLTHEHNDHTNGIKTLYKNFKIPIYLSKGTYTGLSKDILDIIDIMDLNFIKSFDSIKLNNVIINPFFISHDANEPLGYLFDFNDKKILIATDTGYIDQKVMKYFLNNDLYILEANHDPEMLMLSNRPYDLKQRIFSDKGHLSNEECANILINSVGYNTKKVVFAHISEECNLNEKISDTVLKMFKLYDVNLENIEFLFSSQNEPLVIDL